MPHERGMWMMFCFNGLSADQQRRVVEWGNLPFGYTPEGDCQNPAEVEITTMWDLFPGPRFYCAASAIAYLTALPDAAYPVEWAEGSPS